MLALNNARYSAIGDGSAGVVLYSPIRDLRAAADSRGGRSFRRGPRRAFHVHESGPATPSRLALHGWPQHHWAYPICLADPPPGLRIIAPDLPGYGGQAAAHNWAKEEVASDVVACLTRSDSTGAARRARLGRLRRVFLMILMESAVQSNVDPGCIQIINTRRIPPSRAHEQHRSSPSVSSRATTCWHLLLRPVVGGGPDHP